MQTILTLDDLLSPITIETFFADYHRRRWLHVPGNAEKFAPLMSWDILNALLTMSVWNNQTLRLMMDKRPVPPNTYCDSTLDRNEQQSLQPNPQKVMDWMRQGASLLLNRIETLHPELLRAVRAVEQGCGGKSLANVYCSWEGHQGFDSHFDKHDVFALQIAGEKTWRLYEGGAVNPVRHPAFQNMRQTEVDKIKGRVAKEVVMRPGDLMYVPRGLTHDALASSQASIHVTISCMEPVGLDWLTMMWERAVYDPQFRAALPRPAEGDAALVQFLESLSERFRELALSPEGLKEVRRLQQSVMDTPEPYALNAEARGPRTS